MFHALNASLLGPLSYKMLSAIAGATASIRHRIVSSDSAAIRICVFMVTSLWSGVVATVEIRAAPGCRCANLCLRIGDAVNPNVAVVTTFMCAPTEEQA